MNQRIKTADELLSHIFDGGVVEYKHSIHSNKEMMNLPIKCGEKWLKAGVSKIKK